MRQAKEDDSGDFGKGATKPFRFQSFASLVVLQTIEVGVHCNSSKHYCDFHLENLTGSSIGERKSKADEDIGDFGRRQNSLFGFAKF